MKEMAARILFALWLRFGLSMFEEATVFAPEGKVIGVKFGIEPNPPYVITTTGGQNWIYASNGDFCASSI